MCNLWNLETLDIMISRMIFLRFGMDHDCVVTLPSRMWKMKRMRHIYFKGGTLCLPRAHISRGENSDSMPNLQTLRSVAVNLQIASTLKNDSFPNLTKLGLVTIKGESSPQQQLWSLRRLDKLRTLKIDGECSSDLPLDAN